MSFLMVRSHFVGIVSPTASESLPAEKSHDPRNCRKPAPSFCTGQKACEKKLGKRVFTFVDGFVIQHAVNDHNAQYSCDEEKSRADQYVFGYGMSRIISFQFTVNALKAHKYKTTATIKAITRTARHTAEVVVSSCTLSSAAAVVSATSLNSILYPIHNIPKLIYSEGESSST